jgi:hypothetical protein
MGGNPYQGQWDSLIGQLSQQGTPLSDQAFRNASDTAINQTAALSRGGSAGGARQAGMNLSNTQAKMGADYQTAKLQEEMARRQALMGALGGAGNAWWQPASANFGALQNSPTNLQMLTNFLGQAGAIGGMAAGGIPKVGGAGGITGGTQMGPTGLMNPYA